MTTRNGKEDNQIYNEMKSLLAEDPNMSQNGLAYRIGVHYSVIGRLLELLRSKGELPKIDNPVPIPNIPKPVNVVNFTYKPKGDCIKIVPLYDLHIGAEEGLVDWDGLLGTVKYIKNAEDTYTYFGGDHFDGSIHGFGTLKGHPSPWDAMHNMSEQVALYMDEVLSPLARAGKVLGIMPGDHDEWIRRDRGLDLNALMCKWGSEIAGVHIPYLTDGTFINLTVGDNFYRIYTIHGFGGGRTDSGRRAAIGRQFERIVADMKVTGHHHVIDAWKAPLLDQNMVKKCYYVIGGTFLRYQGSYAQNWGLYPNITGVAKLKFFSKKWDEHVSI